MYTFFQQIAGFREVVSKQLIELRHGIVSSRVNSVTDQISVELFDLPVKNSEEVSEFSDWLKSDDNRKQMVNSWFSRVE